jgi:hypothetical protein
MSPGAETGTPSLYGGQSRRSSVHSSGGETVTQEVSPANVKFVRDTSRYWYKPNITREEGKIQNLTMGALIKEYIFIFCML